MLSLDVPTAPSKTDYQTQIYTYSEPLASDGKATVTSIELNDGSDPETYSVSVKYNVDTLQYGYQPNQQVSLFEDPDKKLKIQLANGQIYDLEATSMSQDLVDKLNEAGFIVGIHTNGYNPEIIKKNIDKISFLGIDIKTSKNKYCMASGITDETVIDKVKETIEFVVKSNKQYEFRTTLFPEHVDMEDVKSIALYLKNIGANAYNLQQFYPVNGAKECTPYTYSKLLEIQNACNNILPTKLKSK
jgi:hypothetical protein